MKKFLFDLFPLILFFVAYRYADIFIATGVAMAAAVLQIVWLKLTGKAIEAMHWINLTVIRCSAAPPSGCTAMSSSSGSRPCCTGCSAARWCWRGCSSAAT